MPEPCKKRVKMLFLLEVFFIYASGKRLCISSLRSFAIS